MRVVLWVNLRWNRYTKLPLIMFFNLAVSFMPWFGQRSSECEKNVFELELINSLYRFPFTYARQFLYIFQDVDIFCIVKIDHFSFWPLVIVFHLDEGVWQWNYIFIYGNYFVQGWEGVFMTTFQRAFHWRILHCSYVSVNLLKTI